MEKYEKVEVPERVLPAYTDYEHNLYCDKCGNRIYDCEGNSKIRLLYDSEVYKERKYLWYKGFDFCETCVERFLLPLLSKELQHEPCAYEEELTYEDE